jgi:Protein of unknown function (DUF2934)
MTVSDPYFIVSDPPAVDSGTRHRMIREAAYFLAQRREFLPGHDLEDWLRAEMDIDGELGARRPKADKEP